MKIAVLHSGDLKNVSPGGISQYIEKLIKYNLDNEIFVFGTASIDDNYILMKVYERTVDGKKYKFIPITFNDRKPLSIYYFIKLLKIKKMFNNYDVIYAQRMEYAIPFSFCKVRNKVIFAVHGSGKYAKIFWGNFIGNIYSFIENIALKKSKKVVVLLKRSEYGVPYYKKKMRNLSNKVKYGKVPIDLEYFKKIERTVARETVGLDNNEKIVLYFGRLDDNPKRILLIPEIAKQVIKSEEKIKFIIIGDGEDKSKLLNKISDYKLDKYFIIKNKMNHGDELCNYISSADISIILSTFEGICMSALESIACGVPVIATDVGDINEYIKDNNNGIIIKNSSSDKFLIDRFSTNILNILNNNIILEMNNIFEEYDGKKVIQELNEIFISD